MGLISQEVEVTLNNRKISYYENLGYNIPRIKGKWGYTVPRGTKIIVKTKDLSDGSAIKVKVQCDGCDKIQDIKWADYNKCLHDRKYYCLQCALSLYANENTRQTQLKNTVSFKEWCIKNDRHNILNRWDYELNKYLPEDVSYCSGLKFYFKCPNNLHPSELKNIQHYVTGNSKTLACKACNSFAQWGIDNICSNFLEKYWDYENNINIDPWKIPSQWNKKVWIKCQEKDYHKSYYIKCNDFVGSNARCPYCKKNSGKVHPLDSLGQLLEDRNISLLWSDKNNTSSFNYAPNTSHKKVWWKCHNNIHTDYMRDISSSNRCNFQCPECQNSKGEYLIGQFLICNNIYYIPQKEFDGLLGLGNGNLSYDFFLPHYNILVEYQGEFHDGNGNYYMKQNLEKQQEHDRRKRQYAQDHGIELLEIWYWDYDNIEKILTDKLLK